MMQNTFRINLVLIISLFSITIYAQDWPNLKRYQAQNDSIMKAPARDRGVYG